MPGAIPLDIAVVIPTIGRPASLRTLLRSLAQQTLLPCQVVIADQSGGDEVAAVVDEWSARVPVERVTSELGASRGRNAALRVLRECDVVAFTDDDCWYDPHTLQLAANRLTGAPWEGITGRLESTHGERLSFGDEQVRLDRRTVWTHAIESTVFLTQEVVDAVGEFDETLGVGAPTRWQSGEGTDYLLRALDAGMRIVFFPDVVVHEAAPSVTADEMLRKVRAYGRGTGRVYAMHYGAKDRARLVLRPAVAAMVRAVQGRHDESRRHLQAATGRAEGLLGR